MGGNYSRSEHLLLLLLYVKLLAPVLLQVIKPTHLQEAPMENIQPDCAHSVTLGLCFLFSYYRLAFLSSAVGEHVVGQFFIL